MKKTVTIIFILVLTLMLVPGVFAESPAPGGPFNTAFRVQNLEGTVATCSYSFYDSLGNVAKTSDPTTVAPGDSLFVYVPLVEGLGPGEYSAVVSCDRKVAGVVNFSDPTSGASHAGIADPGTVWYAPGIYDNYYNFYSNIYVQNASSSPINITVDIFEPGNATPVYTQTETNVPMNASVSFEQEGIAQLQTNQFYSARISGTGDIAPIVNIYGRGPAEHQLYSYNPFKSGSTVAYAPIIMNKYYGYDSALVIQNMGDIAAQVKVTYTTGLETTHTIQPGAAESLYTPLQGLPAGNVLYGATVESTNGQPIVAMVNQSNAYMRAATYTGFASGSNEVRAPIVLKSYYTFDSSVVCQNIGNSATTMTIAYAGPGVGSPTTSPSIAPGQVHQFYQPMDPSLANVGPNWIGSATITSSQPIVCVVNQDVIPAYATRVQDDLYSYEGIAP
jgi:hypothetical protein